MHPIERLRYVARSGRVGGDDAGLAQETAHALAGLGDDHAGLVTACRRILDRHPAVGPLWWLAARVLTSPDPVRAARSGAEELGADPTPAVLAGLLPDDGLVCVVGWPELVADAVPRRPDVRLLVVDVYDELAWATGHREGGRQDGEIVPGPGLAAAAAGADLVLLEASAFGAGGVVATAGSHAAAAVARLAGVDVWAVAGLGRGLAPALWEGLVTRLRAGGEPWCAADEVVALELIDRVVGPGGGQVPAEAVASISCPVAPELLRATATLGDAGPPRPRRRQ